MPAHKRKLEDFLSDHARKEWVRPGVPLERARPLNSRSELGQYQAARRLREAWELGKYRQWPLLRLHRECHALDLIHCAVNLDVPRYLDVWDWAIPPVVQKDRYGRVLYMTKGVKKRERVLAQDFAPIVQFEQVFPFHPDPENATEEQKAERMSAFLNLYAASGIASSSAQAVGVNYFQMLIWLNESSLWQSRFAVAVASAKLLLQDVGRMRAFQGDTQLLTFFIKHDNPEMYHRGGGKKEGSELPEGVSSESVLDALKIIQGASEDRDKPPPTPALPTSEDAPTPLAAYSLPDDDDNPLTGITVFPPRVGSN